MAWQPRPLEAFYPVIYLDALVVKVRDGAHVTNRSAHIAVGVDMDGIKHVLGIWVQATEGAKFWAGVCAATGQPRHQGRADRRAATGSPGCPKRSRRPGHGHGANLIYAPWWWRDRPAGCLHRHGQNLCKRVTFEVHMQTCSSAAGRAR